jgi:two-component system, chemotaxis family, chemotaxis protein CheY
MAFDFSNLRVLIVDDNEFMHEIMRELLQALDFSVEKLKFATDGEQALEMLQQTPIDLIVCDLNMKPMNGKDFTNSVRREESSPNPFIPIVICTGHAESNHILDARDCGANEILRKPVNAQSIYSRIRAIVESPRPYVRTESFVGPDRRRRDVPYSGVDRRMSTAEIG